MGDRIHSFARSFADYLVTAAVYAHGVASWMVAKIKERQR